MLKLHLVQAEQGDCLILEHSTSLNPRYILIDGGPATIYKKHLRGKLLGIGASGGKLDLAILSHVDADHIVGLLDLMAELRQQRHSGAAETIAIEALWHNTFSQTVGRDVEARFRRLMQDPIVPRGVMAFSNRAEKSIGQGDELTQFAHALHIPINPEFTPQRLIWAGEAPNTIGLGGLSLRIIGPTRKNLERLRKKWLKWLAEQEKRMRVRDSVRAAEAARKADVSIPNLSSIIILTEAEGKTILLTGDGRWDDLLQGLDQANLLGPDKRRHVNVLKLPHHGSQRNVTKKFFNIVQADKYVICANGKDDNPDLNTLKWIVEAAREGERSIEIFVTNATDSTLQLVEKYAPDEYGYRLVEMEPSEHTMTLEVAA
jgi:beta-lactamase superfamily II metal-dependent hydrolase